MRGRKLILALVIIGSAAALGWKAGEILSIQVRAAKVRSQPHYFLGKQRAKLVYGQRVKVLEEKGAWTKVELPDRQTGWVHNSALTKKTIKLKTGTAGTGTGVSGKEVALAGRGFNRSVEENYRRSQGLDFAGVDRMERGIDITYREIAVFLQEGGLGPWAGGGE